LYYFAYEEDRRIRGYHSQTIINLEKVLDYQTHLLADSMILTSHDWLYILKSGSLGELLSIGVGLQLAYR